MYRIISLDYGNDYGYCSSVTFIKKNESGVIVEAPENEATGIYLKNTGSASNSGIYNLKGHNEFGTNFDTVAVIKHGDILSDRLFELIDGSPILTYTNAALNDCVAAIDSDSGIGSRMTLGNIVSFVRGKINGYLTPEVIVSAPSGSHVTATLGDSVIESDEIKDEDGNSQWMFNLPGRGMWTITVKKGNNFTARRINAVDVNKYTVTFSDSDWLPEMNRSGGLNAYTWSEIDKISKSGLADTYFDVGDTHSVTLNGTVGTLAVNDTWYSYILDFDHDKSSENGLADGITFGTFKTAASNGTDFALSDNKYGFTGTDGTKNFNMNHWGGSNSGGWKGCDLRYDILGSVDKAPSGYGANATGGRTGYNASTTTATNPIVNTLMSALPTDLRAVMKPMCIYSDNLADGQNNLNSVTSSIDYLPLLDECEIFGTATNSNQYTANKQKQYSYYANGNSKIKNKYVESTDRYLPAYWWNRSPYHSNYGNFCAIENNGDPEYRPTYYSYGIAPMFKV